MQKLTAQQKRITILSYTLTLMTGIAVALPFVIQQPVATYFGVSVDKAGYVLGLFMVGMVTTQFLNGFLIKFLSIRIELLIVTIVYALCVLAMYLTDDIAVMIPIIIIIGLCVGIILTIPNYLIVHTFQHEQRSSRMNRLDLSFSVGSCFYPLLAGFLIAQALSWQLVYLLMLVLFAFVWFMLAITELPNLKEQNSANQPGQIYSRWTMPIYLLGISMFLYFMSYVGFTYEITGYLINNMGFSADIANLGISLFWYAYGVGCLISSFAVQYIAVNRYIILSVIVALISYFLIYYAANATMLLISTSLLGLGCATVYTSTISYGTLLVANPSPRLVSFLIVCSGIATFVGQEYATYVQATWGMPTLVMISGVMMALVVVIMLIVAAISRVDIKTRGDYAHGH